MNRRCQVCAHTRVAYVDRLLVTGSRSLRSVAAEVGLPYDSVRRHARNHVAHQRPVVPVGPPAGAPTSPTGPLPAGATPAQVMRRRVDELVAMDTSRMSTRDRLQHSEELRRAAETLQKLEPPARDDRVRLQDVDGLPELIAAMFEALEPHPLARHDLARGLGEAGWLAQQEEQR